MFSRSVFLISLVFSFSMGVRAQTATETVLHLFCSEANCADGYASNYLMEASDANFYGTAEAGGTNSSGVLFQLTPAGKYTVLHNFCSSCADGGSPNPGLVEGSDGSLYGTTSRGGTGSGNGCGTIFKFSPSGKFTTLYTFCEEGGDGEFPDAGLIQGSDGNFYGTTTAGGTCGSGTIFQMTASGTVTTLASFCDGNSEESQVSSLLQGSDGNFYGTTMGLGNTTIYCDTGCGTFFKYSASAGLQTIYSFCAQANCTDGGNPVFAPIEGSNGSFYGATSRGGDSAEYGVGTFYQMTASGAITTFYDFDQYSCAFDPQSPVLASDGNFYDACGNPDYNSEIYEFSPSGTLTFLDTACDPADCMTGGPLVQGSDGDFYGATGSGNNPGGSGMPFYGAIYKVAISPELPAPVQVALSSKSVLPGTKVTASFSVSNAFSLTMQQCYAFVTSNGVTTALGKVGGIYNSSTKLYSGSVSFTPSPGTYNYALTCGGTESGFATLTVAYPTSTTLTANPATVTPPGAVSLQATVKRTSGAGTPTGTVSFSSGTTALGTAKLNGSGVATFQASSSGVGAGQYPVTAVYSGDASDSASIATPVTVSVE